jgi:glucose/arabinose dehydrogenase
MHRAPRLPIMLLIAILSLGPAAGGALARPAPPSPSQPTDTADLAAGQVQLELVLGGLSAPTAIAHAGDGSGRLFIAQQGGTVRVVINNVLQGGTFLNVTGVNTGFSSGGERGLLGIAFHPSFETNRKFYAYYNDGGGDLLIGEFTATADGSTWNGANPAVLLDIEHSAQSNHNGGQLLFGPDGNLYIFTGDGGGSGDPFCNAQSTGSLLGKVLRITVPGNSGFSNPAGNLSGPIWDLGLRNPWRASFDRASGDLWIGDVGQGNYEEIDLKLAGAGGGTNWGWSQREGAHPYSDGSPCASSGIAATDPIAEYQQGSPKAVTGGFVYRGSLEPALVGHYVFADFYSGSLWTLANGVATYHGSTGAMISSFGESESGELYAVDLPSGELYRVVGPPYVDIANSQFYHDILWIHSAGITTGCGGGPFFCPGAAVPREQMASFLARAKGLPSTGTDFFTDDEASIHEDNINRSAAAGITTGCGGGQFCPTSSVSREQMASFLVRALSLPRTGTDFFTDDEGSIHEDDINRLAASGITTGCTGGHYCPHGSVTREQMAAFLRRAFG